MWASSRFLKVHAVATGSGIQLWGEATSHSAGGSAEGPHVSAQVNQLTKYPHSSSAWIIGSYFGQVQDQLKGSEGAAVSARAGHALADAEGDGEGAAGLEDPALHLQLEESEGLHHPTRQEARGRRAGAPAGWRCYLNQ